MKRMKFRLAMREEGEFWNAYLAHGDTMQGAKLIGSLLMRIVRNQEHRDAFLKLLTDAFADAVENMTGERPVMQEEPAPESERSGHG